MRTATRSDSGAEPPRPEPVVGTETRIQVVGALVMRPSAVDVEQDISRPYARIPATSRYISSDSTGAPRAAGGRGRSVSAALAAAEADRARQTEAVRILTSR